MKVFVLIGREVFIGKFSGVYKPVTSIFMTKLFLFFNSSAKPAKLYLNYDKFNGIAGSRKVKTVYL